VQPKNVTFPTDAKLVNRAREKLVKLAKKPGSRAMPILHAESATGTYQAGSWIRPRKVVARLECSLQPDAGEKAVSCSSCRRIDA
jgi:hypothetical protein